MRLKIIPVLLILLASCASPGYRSAEVRIGEDLNLTPEEIMELLPEAAPGSEVTLDILVTDYSGGAETIRITDQGITEGTRDGYVRLLVKVRRRGRIIDAFYMESAGQDREHIKKNLAEALGKRFRAGKQPSAP